MGWVILSDRCEKKISCDTFTRFFYIIIIIRTQFIRMFRLKLGKKNKNKLRTAQC